MPITFSFTTLLDTVGLNPSFELAGSKQGAALYWLLSSVSSQVGIGVFSCTGSPLDPDTWEYAERFETQWYRPGGLVHQFADTLLGTPLSTFSITDTASLSNFIIGLYAAYDYHREAYADPINFLDPIHIEPDKINTAHLPTPSSSLSVLGRLLNSIMPIFNAHILRTTDVHYKVDWQAYLSETPLSIPPTEVDAVARGIVIRDKVSGHLLRTLAGRSNGQSFFTFPEAPYAEQGMFNSGIDTAESFEKFWAIPDIYSLSDQSKMVTVDIPGAVSWPTGHYQFLEYREYVGGEDGITETFDKDWYLPRNEYDVNLPNDLFFARYYDISNSTWRLHANLSAFGISEEFEEGWRGVEDAISRYWHGGAWSLLEREYSAPAGFASRSMASIDLSSGSPVMTYATELAAPDCSPYFYAEVTKALGSTARICFSVTVKYTDASTASFLLWFETTNQAVGSTLFDVAPSTPIDPTKAREKVWAALSKNVVSVTSLSCVYGTTIGAIELKGWQQPAETFETNWTLTLE